MTAEWRAINLVDRRRRQISRLEFFDEADLDAALAKFDEFSRPAPQLENTATKVEERFQACFAARDWAAMARDTGRRHFRRRSSARSERRHPTRSRRQDRGHAGDRRPRYQERDVDRDRHPRAAPCPGAYPPLRGEIERPDAFHTEMLGIVEINADSRMAARVLFDLEDIDAAFEELDARYLAGEAAAHAHTWSLIAGASPQSTDTSFPRRRRTW